MKCKNWLCERYAVNVLSPCNCLNFFMNAGRFVRYCHHRKVFNRLVRKLPPLGHGGSECLRSFRQQWDREAERIKGN